MPLSSDVHSSLLRLLVLCGTSVLLLIVREKDLYGLASSGYSDIIGDLLPSDHSLLP